MMREGSGSDQSSSEDEGDATRSEDHQRNSTLLTQAIGRYLYFYIFEIFKLTASWNSTLRNLEHIFEWTRRGIYSYLAVKVPFLTLREFKWTQPGIFILGICATVFSDDCPEAASEMAICLHTYLERDFTGLEPFLDFSSTSDKWRLLINGPELESECSKFMEMVNCYAELDGECYDILVRRRYSYLVHTLFRLYYWLCDKNKRLKMLLENIACILRMQKQTLCQSSILLPSNVWQRMLRMESGPETCRSFQEQLACVKRSGMIHKHCGNHSQEIYVNGMEIWLEGWCIDDTNNSIRSQSSSCSSLLFALSFFLWILISL